MPDPVVAAIQSAFPPQAWQTMVAIAYAESNLNPRAVGDYLNLPGSCNGACSFGALQINLCAHRFLVAQMSGLQDPCQQAQWLMDPNNNALVAAAIWQSAGYGAWSTWWSDPDRRIGPGQGPYRQFLSIAQSFLSGSASSSSADRLVLLLIFVPVAILAGADLASLF
jgi:hypothetical protein